MPLLDHFHPPWYPKRHWESFHSAWAGALADDLNRRLPEYYIAEEFTHAGAVSRSTWALLKIPLASLARMAARRPPFRRKFGRRRPPPLQSLPSLPMISKCAFSQPRAAPLSSPPSNWSARATKTAPKYRAFAIKCASYLHQGVSLIVVDVVTTRRANLHTQIMGLFKQKKKAHFPAKTSLYAVAYQPLRRLFRTKTPKLDRSVRPWIVEPADAPTYKDAL